MLSYWIVSLTFEALKKPADNDVFSFLFSFLEKVISLFTSRFLIFSGRFEKSRSLRECSYILFYWRVILSWSTRITRFMLLNFRICCFSISDCDISCLDFLVPIWILILSACFYLFIFSAVIVICFFLFPALVQETAIFALLARTRTGSYMRMMSDRMC